MLLKKKFNQEMFADIKVNEKSIHEYNIEEFTTSYKCSEFLDEIWKEVKKILPNMKPVDTVDFTIRDVLGKEKGEAILAKLNSLSIEEKRDLEKPITIDNMTYTKILSFPIMYSGWDCDERGWLVKNPDGEKSFILTNHGTPYISTEKEILGLIQEYNAVICETQKAIDLFKDTGPTPKM